MNLIQIAGFLGTDPDTRFTPSGQKVTSLRVGTKSRKGGKEETLWWRVTIWGDRFDKMVAYLKKGSAVIIIGQMNKPEIYTDKEGRPQVSLDMTAEMIQFSPFGRSEKEAGQQPAGSFNQGGYSQPQQPQQQNAPYEPAFQSAFGSHDPNIDEDPLPF